MAGKSRKNNNPYRKYVTEFANLFRAGSKLPLGKSSATPKSKPKAQRPTALIFSPHPDDECIIGGLALRLRRESGMRVVNVAVTLGSKVERRKARLQELTNACGYLGFDLVKLGLMGFDKVTLQTRDKEPNKWNAMVQATAALIWQRKPTIIFLPHAQDWHPTHIGTHWLVMEALATLPKSFQCTLVETEFWGQMASPNLMVELNENDVADLVAALSLHVGEVRRNPYHLRLPAWMMDNVRRGAELIGGKGGKAPKFTFATLYRVSRWTRSTVALPAKSLPVNRKAAL